MSELEILRRQEYKRNRKKWTLVQLVAIAVLISMALISFLIYSRMNRTQYIEYTEVGGIDYKVQYDPNSFFDEEWLEKEQTYISSITNGITADFSYKMNTSSNEMKFDYKYSINAKLLIANKEKGTPYYTYEEVIVPQAEGRVENEAQLAITESAIIDYDKYNSMAKSFVDTYGLQNVSSCTLIVSLDVNTVCSNNGYDDRNTVVYSTS